MFICVNQNKFILTYLLYYFLSYLHTLYLFLILFNIHNIFIVDLVTSQLPSYTVAKYNQCANLFRQYKTKIKNINSKERIFWRTRKKNTGSVMINTFLNISSRPEGSLHDFCKFYTACMESKGCYNLTDSLKTFREDFCFDSVGMLFKIFGPM